MLNVRTALSVVTVTPTTYKIDFDVQLSVDEMHNYKIFNCYKCVACSIEAEIGIVVHVEFAVAAKTCTIIQFTSYEIGR